MIVRPQISTLFPYTTLFRSAKTSADLVIAQDPDADRCAVAVGGRILRGDELGALLAVHLLRSGRAPGTFATTIVIGIRSEEHTSELQSRVDLVCRLLLEKKK